VKIMNLKKASFEFAVGIPSGFPLCTVPEIVFSGRSNVGKSSMINSLLNRKSLAHTSSAPGKTATVNFYNIGFCRFVDLPGYGYAKVPPAEKQRWAELVEGYFAAERDVRLVIQIFDMRRPPTQDDMQMIYFLKDSGIPLIAAAAKSDKLNSSKRSEQISRLDEIFRKINAEYIPFSSFSGEGAEQIRRRIIASCRR